MVANCFFDAHTVPFGNPNWYPWHRSFNWPPNCFLEWGMNNRPTLSGSLDPDDWTEFRRQAHRMLDDMFGYMENIRDYPVWQVIPDEVRERFRAALPIQPTS